uniref:Uncharacterized protein n=1 Tax=Ananas comosus var. bracteatus TaxID=296719 RepID=A0A6V7PI31_ANACO|nr:unnamed protein product [Ananas comosus var. bracteatus]
MEVCKKGGMLEDGRENMRYYSSSWINEDPNQVPLHKDFEISKIRNKCLKRLFPNNEERIVVNEKFAIFPLPERDLMSMTQLKIRGPLNERNGGSFMVPQHLCSKI